MHLYENITFVCELEKKYALEPIINSIRYTQSFDIVVFRGYTGEVLVAFLKSIYRIFIYLYICSVCVCVCVKGRGGGLE